MPSSAVIRPLININGALGLCRKWPMGTLDLGVRAYYCYYVLGSDAILGEGALMAF